MSWAIIKPNRGVNRMTSWSSDFLRLHAVALTEYTLVLAGPRACYFFCTFRTDVIMHNRTADVSSAAVRVGFDCFLMTPWMAFQNPSCYKICAALAQAANQTREIFAAVTTRTSYAPVWLQAQKMKSLRRRDGILMPRRV